MAAVSNARRERFCQELLVDDNQTRAHIRSGHPGRGAVRSARRLIGRPKVAARLNECAGLTPDGIVAALIERDSS